MDSVTPVQVSDSIMFLHAVVNCSGSCSEATIRERIEAVELLLSLRPERAPAPEPASAQPEEEKPQSTKQATGSDTLTYLPKNRIDIASRDELIAEVKRLRGKCGNTARSRALARDYDLFNDLRSAKTSAKYATKHLMQPLTDEIRTSVEKWRKSVEAHEAKLIEDYGSEV